MRKFVRMFSAFCLTAVLVLSACGKEEPKGNDESGLSPYDIPHVEPVAPEPLTDNGEPLSSYRIVVAEDCGASVEYAATLMRKYVKDVTSVELPIVTDAEAETEHEILIGKTNRAEDDDIDFDALGKESYRVKTVGNDLVIAGNERGSLYGMYAYLEALGYRWFTSSTLSYTTQATATPAKSEVFVASDADLSWDPVFEYREVMYCATWNADFAVANAINSDFQRADLKTDPKYGGYSGYVGGGKMLVHTAQYLLPSRYFTEHSTYPDNWFNQQGDQPCWTNTDALDAMYEEMKKQIAADPTSTVINVSENDNSHYCQCPRCQASYDSIGLSETYFKAINYLARKLKADYPDVKLITLSYGMGHEVPDTAKMGEAIEDNVVIQIAHKGCKWHLDPDDCETLAAQKAAIEGWTKICKQIYIYSYPINWHWLYAAHPNLWNMRSQIRMFAELGATGVYAEGYSKIDPEFAELKAYLMAKLMKDPYMSEGEYEYHIRDFLMHYYGDAWEPIREYLDEANELILKQHPGLGLEDDNEHIAHWFSLDKNFTFDWDRTAHDYSDETWDFIDRFNELWDEAESLAVVQPELDRVRKSRMHWDFLELYNTFDNRMRYKLNEDELPARAERLYKDILRFGAIRAFDNSSDITTGITDFETRSPQYWWRT